jgi:hypothetical protein
LTGVAFILNNAILNKNFNVSVIHSQEIKNSLPFTRSILPSSTPEPCKGSTPSFLLLPVDKFCVKSSSGSLSHHALMKKKNRP